MTLIKSRIYSKLYAAKALQKTSPKEVYNIVRELQEELEEWHSASPFSQQLKPRGAGEDFLVGFATAGLQFGYYNSKIMIHRLPLILHFAYLHHSTIDVKWDVDHKTIFNESSAASAICVQAARDTLKLVNNLPWGDIAWIWSLLYYIFLAVTIIFTYILRDSQHPHAREDLHHLSMAATFFATLIPGDGPCNYAKFMTKMCTNFERVARAVVEREQKATRTSDKHNQPGTFCRKLNEQKEKTVSSNEQSSPSSSSVNNEIPQIEGFPRINSSGYVVPESPSDTPDDLYSTDQAATNGFFQGGFPASQPLETPSRPAQQSYTNPYPTDQPFPIYLTENMPQPELWQIPLTADWELGGQFLGLFGSQFDYSGNNDPMSTMAAMAAPPMPSAAMNMGVNYEYQNMPDSGEGYPMCAARGSMNSF
ncbi:hypothetical protein BBP40_008278 [Aspergillus hancockii]|nr:hypothetical protein BBP40_008278 [Aspergillus hancockii]